jgi:nicotinamidase-related amidase
VEIEGHEVPADMKRPALIVIDMVHDFLDDWDATRKQKLLNSTNELAGAMRDRGYPVIWVRQEFEPDLRDAFLEMRAKGIRKTIRGTKGCQIVPELAVAASDIAIVKKRYSAFYGTNLDETLARLQPDSIVLAGINTHACIRTTAIDAYQRDWNVVLAFDCIDSYDQEHHQVSLQYMRDKLAAVMTNEEILSALDRAG